MHYKKYLCRVALQFIRIILLPFFLMNVADKIYLPKSNSKYLEYLPPREFICKIEDDVIIDVREKSAVYLGFLPSTLYIPYEIAKTWDDIADISKYLDKQVQIPNNPDVEKIMRFKELLENENKAISMVCKYTLKEIAQILAYDHTKRITVLGGGMLDYWRAFVEENTENDALDPDLHNMRSQVLSQIPEVLNEENPGSSLVLKSCHKLEQPGCLPKPVFMDSDLNQTKGEVHRKGVSPVSAILRSLILPNSEAYQD